MPDFDMDAAGPSVRHRPRPLDLVPIDMDAAPYVVNALDWSADGGLAAATVDSVHIFTPQFQTASGNTMPIFDGRVTDGGSPPEEEIDGPVDSQFATETGARKQFGASSRRILVGYPRLDHTINMPLFDEWHLDHPTNGGGSSHGQWQADHPNISAGSGSISGSGSSMNSIVSIAWSPSGVGRNERCILGVLTASGMLIIYGEPLDGGESDGTTTNGSRNNVSGSRSSYDTSRWEVLFAVGERLAVPGQKKPGECILSFTWSGECETLEDDRLPPSEGQRRTETKALLVYQNDKKDIVVLDVGHSRHGDGRTTWKVSEAQRIKEATGVHTLPPGFSLMTDPNYVPHLTPFGLRCSPWMVEKVPVGDDRPPETILTCVVGYTASHYVGFRRLSLVLRPSVGSGERTITLDKHDTAGFCTFMSTNAILRFEDGLWSVDDDMHTGVPKKRSKCRAVVATPMEVVSYEFEFAARDPNLPVRVSGVPTDHIFGTEGECAATNPAPTQWHTNPISGLIVHPPDTRNADNGPFYSFVRRDATSIATDWHDAFSVGQDRPEWVNVIERKVTRLDGESAPDQAADAAAQSLETNTLASQDRLHVRTWGLTQAPGGLPGAGGITAVLMNECTIGDRQSGRTQRGCQILFGVQRQQPSDAASDTEPANMFASRYERPAATTEAAVWTYMYGGGPEVVSRTVGSTREGIVASQKCSICTSSIKERDEMMICTDGHSFDKCTGTGLAIQKPNVSRVCGVCGRKTLVPSALDEILTLSGIDDTNKGELYGRLLDKVCGLCGGKFFGK
ncbi:glycosylphosphatidylinositol anchor biosynthesis [Sporothrix stenoceras]|uniref:Glycosylphosphatidylinositol anchor biosynthesis n=1 Tax=Sporothrix stenoceras TaxID=5173 RepID=A0ABR3YL27_9PEZI